MAIIAASGASVYATIFATSNIVTVNVQYNVSLSQITTGSQVALTATVTNNGEAVSGLNVDFYVSIDSGATWSNFASATTNGSGVASATYILAINGAYDFKAVATVS